MVTVPPLRHRLGDGPREKIPLTYPGECFCAETGIRRRWGKWELLVGEQMEKFLRKETKDFGDIRVEVIGVMEG